MNWDNLTNCLKITAFMRTNVVCDEFLPIDGIFYYYYMQQQFGYETVSYPNQKSSNIEIVLPLKIINSDTESWYYSASWAYPIKKWWFAEGQDRWTKKIDLSLADYIDFGKKRGAIPHKSGKYKLYNMPVFYKVVNEITWYVVGNKEEIEKILSIAFYIGKKSAQGWGRVNKWQVEEIDDDFSIKKDGKLTRGIPSDILNIKDGDKIINYGYRPSYWAKENQTWLKIE